MGKELPNSKRLALLLDKIFRLNHNIVTHIIKSYSNEEYSKQPLLNEKLEEVFFAKLSKLYKELRDLIREAIEVGDEMTINGLEDSFSDDAIEEFRLEGREQSKDHIQEAMMNRMKAFYVTMNFVPLVFSNSTQTKTVDSIYSGKLEESLRLQEYLQVLDSLEKQIEIVDIEDYFSLYAEESLFEISPSVYPSIFDALADHQKYKIAESNCAKFVKAYKAKEDQFEEFPEFKEITEKVAYLQLQEHYKKLFSLATGYLNPNTTYSKYVMNLVNSQSLPFFTGLESDEIEARIQTQINEYNEENRQAIRDIYDNAIMKYKRKLTISEIIEKGKFRLPVIGPGLKKKRYKISSSPKVTDDSKTKGESSKKQDDKKSSINHGRHEERE